jgi:DNA-binding transcriptional LysR family regulator
MSTQLKIRDLEMVVALHEEKTFTQAAKRVGVTQTALSKRVQAIERRVKLRLFDRTHDGAVLTEPGRWFIAGAGEIIHTFQRTIHDAQEARHGESQKLRIGVSMYLPPDLIETIHAIELPLYKHLAIEIASGFSPELISDLQSKNVDLALVTSPTPNVALTTLCIATHQFVIIFRKGHPLAAKRSVTLGEIAAYPWVFFKRVIHPFLHDLILHRVEAEHQQADIVHFGTHVKAKSKSSTERCPLKRTSRLCQYRRFCTQIRCPVWSCMTRWPVPRRAAAGRPTPRVDRRAARSPQCPAHRRALPRRSLLRFSAKTAPRIRGEPRAPVLLPRWNEQGTRPRQLTRPTFSLIIRVGMDNEKIEVNPAARIRRKTEGSGRVRFLSDVEEKRLCAAIERRFPEFLPHFLLSIHTGMRMGEQYGLRWNQVDFARRQLHLLHTKNSDPRIIPLNAIAQGALRQLGGEKKPQLTSTSTKSSKTALSGNWGGAKRSHRGQTRFFCLCAREMPCRGRADGLRRLLKRQKSLITHGIAIVIRLPVDYRFGK